MTTITKVKRSPFTSLFIPKRVIADMSYPNYSINERSLDNVRFLLSPIENKNKSFLLIIIAQESISPMQYGYETFSLIKAFLDCYDIKIEDVEIILDYAQRTGMNKNSTDKWIFDTDKKGKYVIDFLADIEDSLKEIVKATRTKYYKDFNINIQW